ncbi:MAG: UvrD-helicase domain-containing protein [Flavobacteriales bacterium]|nr:UvrD-helicase domain-containing protein [Flavobacteriales bacterium]MCB9203887.1 UvrD-helicase domain-containing protein [Flavobacteriales bacterium]
MEYLNELNDEQRRAVEQLQGPVMIIAGAGSGKTRVLTYRVAHLINSGADPFNILALTFTNKAAKEMRTRIETMVGPEARNIWMGTFHSVFAKILRFEAEKIGYPSNFTIYDTADSKNLIKAILKEEQLDDKTYKPSLVLNRISAAKTNLISANEYLKNDELFAEDRMSAKPKLGILYQKYSERLFRSGAMDFDDLLYWTNVLLRDFPDVLNKYQNRFKFVMVDEYQDTNYAQYLIVKRLAAKFENICVVGDDAQSIYAFRGANIQNILNFRKDYPDVKTYKLEQNYRSTKHIVGAANQVIEQNKDRLKKTVWTSNTEGEPIKVVRNLTDNEEGMMVARSIFETKMNEQAHDKEFAVLYRTNAQSRAIEEAMRKMNIPYRIYGGQSFYQRKEIKDLIAYFRMVINPQDEEALKRIINYPARGIGKTTVDKVTILANDWKKDAYSIISSPEIRQAQFNAGTAKKLEMFVNMIESFRIDLPKVDAYELGARIASTSGLVGDLYSDKSPEGVSRYENVQELLNGLKEFVEEQPGEDEVVVEPQIKTLDRFTEDIALLTDADKDNDPENNNKVSLMTIHASKGLEFPYVYIVGLEENLFPSQLSLSSRQDLEEERRLFYVALTRAEKKVQLSYAVSRFRWGNLVHSEPSRFIEEIPEAHLDVTASKPAVSNNSVTSSGWSRKTQPFNRKPLLSTGKRMETKSRNLTKYDDSRKPSGLDTGEGNSEHVNRIIVGTEVIHDKFGKGEVIAMDGVAPNIKATVAFQGAGNKQLLLKFAKLRIVGKAKQ